MTIDQLCSPGGEAFAIARDTSVADVLDRFRGATGARMLAVLDGERRPLGAIFEEDIRHILYHPYGHALMANPGAHDLIADRIRPCPSIEHDCSLTDLLRRYALSDLRDDREAGMIVTISGRYHGIIEGRALVAAAGRIELERLRGHEAELHRVHAIGTAFEAEIGEIGAQLSAAAERLGQAATGTVRRSQAITHHAREVATAATGTDRIAETLSEGVTSLVAALDTLHVKAESAEQVAGQAVTRTVECSRRIETLLESTTLIQTVTQWIDALGAKVRMLAINATIEAARAGAAGRGFGVVANEVRDLAGQTRTAAEQIGHHAATVRAAAMQVVTEHHGIETIVTHLDQLAQSVVRALETKRAITRGIAAGAGQVAIASREIRDSIDVIQQGADDALIHARETEHDAAGLGDCSRRLRTRVAGFLEDLESAGPFA